MWRRSAVRSATAGRLRDVTGARTDAAKGTICSDSRRVRDVGAPRRALTVVELALLCGRSVEQIEAEIVAVNDP
jgi:hypothetical protein